VITWSIIEVSIPDNLLSIMLLGLLPEEFENFTVAIESRDEIPSVNNLKIKLLKEEARQTERDECLDKEKKGDASSEALYTKARKQTNSRVDKNKDNAKS